MSLEVRSTIPDLSEKTKPVTIAVTGNAGSGKTVVCGRFKALGVPVIFSDALAREVVMPGSAVLSRISERFGDELLTPDGSLDRSAMRRLMLQDDQARRDLEALLHPEIISLMRARIRQAGKEGARVVMVEVPLLFEGNAASFFDRVLLVTADNARQVTRLVARDRVSDADAHALLGAQMPDDQKRERSDFIINNNGSIEELIKTVDRLYQMIYQKN
ncbi:MAG: dephospho-CoA kinase [Desulfobacterales bacterium]|nr:dephospho-CoA kinase [Desulfobacterales bacterium]